MHKKKKSANISKGEQNHKIYQFLPFFSQSGGFPEVLADPEPLELQSDTSGVGFHGSVSNAQLLLQNRPIGRLAALR